MIATPAEFKTLEKKAGDLAHGDTVWYTDESLATIASIAPAKADGWILIGYAADRDGKGEWDQFRVDGIVPVVDKAKAAKLVITFTEAGPFNGLTVEADTTSLWVKANAILTMLLGEARRTQPEGYIKTYFELTYADGDVYTGRIDLGDSANGEGEQSLGEHMQRHLDAVVSGRLPRLDESERTQARLFRDTHEVIA